MSVRSDNKATTEQDPLGARGESASTDATLGEGNSYCVAAPVRLSPNALGISLYTACVCGRSHALSTHTNTYTHTTPQDNPLQRNLVVSIRASLNDLCLSKGKGTWAPSADALKAILQ